MGLIFLIVLGATLGWLATVILAERGGQNLLVNLASGIGGALAGGLLLNPLVGGGDLLGGSYRVESLLIALIGASLALISVNLLRHTEMR